MCILQKLLSNNTWAEDKRFVYSQAEQGKSEQNTFAVLLFIICGTFRCNSESWLSKCVKWHKPVYEDTTGPSYQKLKDERTKTAPIKRLYHDCSLCLTLALLEEKRFVLTGQHSRAGTAVGSVGPCSARTPSSPHSQLHHRNLCPGITKHSCRALNPPPPRHLSICLVTTMSVFPIML